jgi:hypothetical protein
VANPQFVGVAEVQGLGAGVVVFTSPAGVALYSGSITPKPIKFDAKHVASVKDIKNQNGQTVGFIASDEHLEMTFDVIPEDPTSQANVLIAASIPPMLSKAVITGLKIIAIGPWSDGLNVGGAGILAAPWIYKEGAGLNGDQENPWGINLTLFRYPLVLGNTNIA